LAVAIRLIDAINPVVSHSCGLSSDVMARPKRRAVDLW
jgi:hypothetical protein